MNTFPWNIWSMTLQHGQGARPRGSQRAGSRAGGRQRGQAEAKQPPLGHFSELNVKELTKGR